MRGKGHLKGLNVSVGKKTSLSTQRLLGQGKDRGDGVMQLNQMRKLFSRAR